MSKHAANCARCGHLSDHHRLDDAKGVGPCEPAAEFRCTVTHDRRIHPSYNPSVSSRDYCDCPNFVEASAQSDGGVSR